MTSAFCWQNSISLCPLFHFVLQGQICHVFPESSSENICHLTSVPHDSASFVCLLFGLCLLSWQITPHQGPHARGPGPHTADLSHVSQSTGIRWRVSHKDSKGSNLIDLLLSRELIARDSLVSLYLLFILAMLHLLSPMTTRYHEKTDKLIN